MGFYLALRGEGVGILYRPTVVESCKCAFHFPSPPSSVYGIVMPLGEPQDAAYREVIHPPLITPEAFASVCSIKLGKITDPSLQAHDRIGALRSDHRQRLQREFTKPEDLSWLDQHRGLL